jgi:hypothetical protein
VPSNTDRDGSTTLVLNKSHFAAASRSGPSIDYFGTTNTANLRFIDAFYGGNPTNYVTTAWGLNDACPQAIDQVRRLERKRVFPSGVGVLSDYTGGLGKAPRWVRTFRRNAVVNMYAETAPLVDLRRLTQAFQVGVDRILTRTVSETGS